MLDRSYQVFSNGGKVDEQCEKTVNGTISQIRASSNDSCVIKHFNKRSFSESLLKEYLLPQLKAKQTEVQFDERFKAFQAKAVNITTIICRNPRVFNPDLRALLRSKRMEKDGKTKEIDCLQKHILIKNKPVDEECKKVVASIQDEFYNSTAGDMKRVFAAPNDNLIDLKCSAEKARKAQLFEKIFFFVVLAATKNMNDKQINTLLRSADGVIGGSSRLIFECMM